MASRRASRRTAGAASVSMAGVPLTSRPVYVLLWRCEGRIRSSGSSYSDWLHGCHCADRAAARTDGGVLWQREFYRADVGKLALLDRRGEQPGRAFYDAHTATAPPDGRHPGADRRHPAVDHPRSEEHTSELQ